MAANEDVHLKDVTLVCWNTFKSSKQQEEKELRHEYITRYLQNVQYPDIIFLQEVSWSGKMPREFREFYNRATPFNGKKSGNCEALLLYAKKLKLEPWPIHKVVATTPPAKGTKMDTDISTLFTDRATAVVTKTKERVGFVNVHFMLNKPDTTNPTNTSDAKNSISVPRSKKIASDHNPDVSEETISKHKGPLSDNNKLEIIKRFLTDLMKWHVSQAEDKNCTAGSVIVAADWNIAMEKLEPDLSTMFGSKCVIHNSGTGREVDGIIQIWPQELATPSLDVTQFFYDKHALYSLYVTNWKSGPTEKIPLKPEEMFDHKPLRCTATFTHNKGLTMVSWNQHRINKQHQPLTSQQLNDAKVYVEGYVRSVKPNIIFVQNSKWIPGHLQQLMPAGREYEATTSCTTEIILHDKALSLREWDIRKFSARAAAVCLTRRNVLVGLVTVCFKEKGETVTQKQKLIKKFVEDLVNQHTSHAEDPNNAGSVVIAADWCISMDQLKSLLLEISSLKHVIHNSGHKNETDGIVEIWPENSQASWDVTEFFYDKHVLYNLATGNVRNSKPKDLFDCIPLKCTATFTDHHKGTETVWIPVSQPDENILYNVVCLPHLSFDPQTGQQLLTYKPTGHFVEPKRSTQLNSAWSNNAWSNRERGRARTKSTSTREVRRSSI